MQRTADIAAALQSLKPGAQWVLRGNEYAGLEWLDQEQTQPTEAEVTAEIARLNDQYPLDECAAKAKELLVATDWSQLADVGLANKSDFDTYRAAIRALVLNPVADPEFPAKPVAQWS